MDSLKISDLLNAISDDASLDLFRLIALTDGRTEHLKNKMQITRKQYYSRIFKLVRCGLVQKQDGGHSLTAIGRILYEAQACIESALDYRRTRADNSLKVAESIP